MYKTLTIVATLAIGASAYLPTEIRDHVNARAMMAAVSNEKIRETYGLNEKKQVKLQSQKLQQDFEF